MTQHAEISSRRQNIQRRSSSNSLVAHARRWRSYPPDGYRSNRPDASISGHPDGLRQRTPRQPPSEAAPAASRNALVDKTMRLLANLAPVDIAPVDKPPPLGRPDRLPRPPGRPKQASQAAPAAGMASRNVLVDKTMRLSAKPCSCRHCSCRQNIALWPCQTGPRLSRQALRPSRKAPPAFPVVGAATKNALVDKTLLLATRACSC